MFSLILCAFCVIVLTCVLISCGSMDNYEENLGRRYTVQYLDQDYIEFYTKLYDFPFDVYDVECGMKADHKNSEKFVVIFECQSKSSARKLAKDLTYDIENTEYKDLDIKRDGKFVFLGDKTSVTVALG